MMWDTAAKIRDSAQKDRPKKCLLCGHESQLWTEELTRQGVLRYFRCSHCGLIRKEPFPDRNTESEHYRQHENSLQDPGYRNYMSTIIDAHLRPLLFSGARVLDYGCGPEKALEELLSESNASVLCRSWDPLFHPHEISLHRTTKSLAPDARFDIIAAIEVFEHFHAPADSLDKISSLLAPGGKLLVRTMSPPDQVESFLSWWYRQDLSHVHFFPQTSFDWICSARSWEIMLHDAKNHIRILVDKIR